MSALDSGLLTVTTSDSERSIASTTISKSEWSLWHTIWAIAIRMVGDILSKNLVVFYDDYSHALGLSVPEFSIVVISQQFGAVLAMILLPFITRIIPSLHHKICISGFLCGLFSLLTIVSPIIDPGHTHTMFVIIWTSMIRLLFSMSFYMYITSILDLASKCNDENSGKQGKIIALLNLSWSLASLFYFVTGFTIEYINWWFAFVLYGMTLCIMSIFTYFVYGNFTHYGNMEHLGEIRNGEIDANKSKQTPSWLDSIRSVLCSQVSILIFTCSCIMGAFTSSFGIIVASLWFEDIYGLDAFDVGLVAIAIFAGEITGCFTLQPLIDAYGPFKCCVLSYGSILSACVSAFALWMAFGPTVGGMAVAIAIVYVLYFGWESFFIQHQIICIQNSPTRNHTSLMLMMNFVWITFGGMGGSFMAAELWNNGEGMGLIILIWIGFIVTASVIYGGLYFMTSNNRVNRTRSE